MCSIDHDALKRDDERWQTLRFVGLQRVEGEPTLELRDCPECKSTLAIETHDQSVTE